LWRTGANGPSVAGLDEPNELVGDRSTGVDVDGRGGGLHLLLLGLAYYPRRRDFRRHIVTPAQPPVVLPSAGAAAARPEVGIGVDSGVGSAQCSAGSEAGLQPGKLRIPPHQADHRNGEGCARPVVVDERPRLACRELRGALLE
jgi:hypothetical protein